MRVLGHAKELSNETIDKIAFIDETYFVITTTSGKIMVIEISFNDDFDVDYYYFSSVYTSMELKNGFDKLLLREKIFSNSELEELIKDIERENEENYRQIQAKIREKEYKEYLILKNKFEKESE